MKLVKHMSANLMAVSLEKEHELLVVAICFCLITYDNASFSVFVIIY